MNTVNLKLLESRLELYFQAQGIDIELNRKEDYLQILLESEDIPDRNKCLSLIKQIITNSPEEKIDLIRVYGRKRHEYSPEWTDELSISDEIVLDFKLLESKLELYFQVKGIDIEIVNKKNYLQILLEAEKAPNHKKCFSLIKQILRDSQEEKIDLIKIYGRKRHEHFPEWTDELIIDLEAKTDLTELAQKRNIESIVAILNQDLNTDLINIKASWKNDCLRIMLLSEREIDKVFGVKVKDKIFDLDIENCHKVKVCSQRSNDSFPDWLEEFYNKLQSTEVQNHSTVSTSAKSKLALAKQGNADAIAYSLNYLFQDRQIVTTVIINHNWLEITLKANKFPDRDFLISYITNFVRKLEIKQIDTLQIYAWKKGETCESWSKTISLN
ncbi:MAG: hypothetical protein AAGE96_23815 [Cyanobacteria bacterium P01_G01_bin.19]